MTSNGTDLEDAIRLKQLELDALRRERRSEGTSTGGHQELSEGTTQVTANGSTPSASLTSEEESNDEVAGTSPLAGNTNSNTTTTPSEIQSFRKRLLYENAKSYGPVILSASPTIAELLATTGYGHIMLDMEHSPVDIAGTINMLRAVDAASFRGRDSTQNVPIVRATTHDNPGLTKQILDVLRPPGGIMFPMVENAEQAKAAVASTRYPPHGGFRGCAHPYVRASQYGKNTEYFDVDTRDLLTIVQVESKDAIEKIPEIGLVDGVDAIFLGPFDISCSINQVGNFEEGGEVMDLLRHAEALVRETRQKKKDETNGRLILSGFRSFGRSLEEMFSDDVGYQLVCGSADIGLLQTAAVNDLKMAEKCMK